ncbi:MAG: hypothetical protein LBJ10_06750 [Clostridiales bacterium]|jgi:hypothetical protein|nr:hypothetical protein [Clostridiales bacterium]
MDNNSTDSGGVVAGGNVVGGAANLQGQADGQGDAQASGGHGNGEQGSALTSGQADAQSDDARASLQAGTQIGTQADAQASGGQGSALTGGQADAQAAGQGYAFVLTASNRLEAEAYEEMLHKGGLAVYKELCAPSGRFAPIMADNSEPLGVNIYVEQRQLAKARELLEKYESEPIEYGMPIGGFRQKSKARQMLFWAMVFVVFIMPIAIAVVVIIRNLVKKYL